MMLAVELKEGPLDMLNMPTGGVMDGFGHSMCTYARTRTLVPMIVVCRHPECSEKAFGGYERRAYGPALRKGQKGVAYLHLDIIPDMGKMGGGWCGEWWCNLLNAWPSVHWAGNAVPNPFSTARWTGR